MRALTILTTAVAVLAFAAPAGAARLTRADRAAINQTLDTFVATAVKRNDVGASYDLVTPELRNGLSRAQWAKGDIPVYPYDARGTKFHGWTVSYVYGNEVGIVLMLRPRNVRQDTFAFDVTVKRARGRWLVDSFIPAATFANPAHPRVVGPYDFTAAAGESGTGERHLSAVWIAVPTAVVGLALFVALGILLMAWRRNRPEAVSAAERARYQEFAERVHKRTAAGT
jgi:hypothetical protein